MFQIGIVDDDDRSIEVVLRHLRRHQDEHGTEFTVRPFRDGRDLVGGYRSDLDVLFLDVEMPTVGGFEVAHRIREVDVRVVIVFVTRMGQLTIRGYEVGALSYLVKPPAQCVGHGTISARPLRSAPSRCSISRAQTL